MEIQEPHIYTLLYHHRTNNEPISDFANLRTKCSQPPSSLPSDSLLQLPQHPKVLTTLVWASISALEQTLRAIPLAPTQHVFGKRPRTPLVMTYPNLLWPMMSRDTSPFRQTRAIFAIYLSRAGATRLSLTSILRRQVFMTCGRNEEICCCSSSY